MSNNDTDSEGDPARAFARALFAKDASEGEELAVPDPAMANHVPGEGTNPATHTDPTDMRDFTIALFAPDPDA